MFRYKIETMKIRTQSKITVARFESEECISDSECSAKAWTYARPGEPALISESFDGEDFVPRWIVGWGGDSGAFADTTRNDCRWVPAR